MTITKQTVMQTLNEASWAPRYSDREIALLEQAVREADAIADLQLGFRARSRLLQAAFHTGALDKAMVSYSWMLGRADALSEEFSAHEVLWLYKWVAGEAANFPEISRPQLTQMLDDMEARYRRAGSTMRAVFHARAEVALSLYAFDDVRAFHALWQDKKRDSLSDCVACEMSQNVLFYAKTGRDQEAVDAAKPLLHGKRHTCEQVPHVTFAYALLPLLRLGYLDEAARCHREGYRLITKLGGRQVDRFAEHIQFLALTGNFTRAVTLFENHLPSALAHACPAPRMRFFSAAALLFSRAADTHDAPLTLKIPSTFVLHRPEHRYVPSELTRGLLQEARSIAARFDQRNGDTNTSRSIEEETALSKIAVDFAISRPETAD